MMMRNLCLVFGILTLSAGAALAGVEVGQPAPDFSLPDTNGQTHQLSQYKGKWVVLEWYQPDCPFVKKHYGSGNMQALQKEFTAKGVVWLSIDSSAPGEEGNYPADKLNQIATSQGAARTALLLDPEGKVGHDYGAKTTPDMYIINPEGKLVYEGAIDNKPTTVVADIKTATNYVKVALDSSMTGKSVSQTVTRPYGCSVKYAQ
ncbi:MAG TPA: thioredoxin family protein [Chthoniobacterales bacterium]|jgi:peroxiredoxin|nr:thioredoxin family protein [Chthoniobacterales bacterium]